MSQEFWDQVQQLLKPNQRVEIEYRVYYDDTGFIYRCSQLPQDHIEGNYLVVTREQYELPHHYRVHNGRMVKLDNLALYRVQLRRSNSGYAVVQGHANLLIEDEEYKDIEYYDRNR